MNPEYVSCLSSYLPLYGILQIANLSSLGILCTEPVSHFGSIPILKVLHMESARARAPAQIEVTKICPNPNHKSTHFEIYPYSGACSPVTFGTSNIGLLSKCYTGILS